MKILRAPFIIAMDQGLHALAEASKIYIYKKSYGSLNVLDSRHKVHVIESIANTIPHFESNPFEIRYASPDEINYVSGLSPPRLYGVSCGGNWDKVSYQSFEYVPYDPKIPITSTLAYRGLREYIQNGNTDLLFEHFQNHVTNPESRPWGHSSIDSFDRRLNEIDSLCTSIRERGYLTQRELIELEGDSIRRRNNELVPPELNEIVVDIGRNGELLHAGHGTHRLTIAKLLDIETVPVIVAARHSDLARDPLRD